MTTNRRKPLNEIPGFIIISGPKACGKTRSRQALLEIFPADALVDDWTGSIKELEKEICTVHQSCLSVGEAPRVMVLTHLSPAEISRMGTQARLSESGFISAVIEFESLKYKIEKIEAGKPEPKKERVTILPLPLRPHQPAFVKLGDHVHGTTLIMQQQLLTHIETTISRSDAIVLAKALVTHFDLPFTPQIKDVEGCPHIWKKQVCPDIHQPDYFVCEYCGVAKE